MSTRVPFALLALALAAAPAAVRAQEIYTASAVHMRTGPGPQFEVIATLPAGVPVTVLQCVDAGFWCRIAVSNLDGWVGAGYLNGGIFPHDPGPRFGQRDERYPPPVYFEPAPPPPLPELIPPADIGPAPYPPPEPAYPSAGHRPRWQDAPWIASPQREPMRPEPPYRADPRWDGTTPRRDGPASHVARPAPETLPRAIDPRPAAPRDPGGRQAARTAPEPVPLPPPRPDEMPARPDIGGAGVGGAAEAVAEPDKDTAAVDPMARPAEPATASGSGSDKAAATASDAAAADKETSDGPRVVYPSPYEDSGLQGDADKECTVGDRRPRCYGG